jgi:hypothetical protein
VDTEHRSTASAASDALPSSMWTVSRAKSATIVYDTMIILCYASPYHLTVCRVTRDRCTTNYPDEQESTSACITHIHGMRQPSSKGPRQQSNSAPARAAAKPICAGTGNIDLYVSLSHLTLPGSGGYASWSNSLCVSLACGLLAGMIAAGSNSPF